MNKSQDHIPEEEMKLPDILPVLPLKDVVLFPYIILPLSVGRDKSIEAVDQALAENRIIMLAAQKDPTVEEPGQDDIYHWGTAALIMRMLKLPDGRIRILVQGLSRARIEHFSQTEPFLKAKVEQINEYPVDEPSLELEALTRAVKEGLDTVVNLGKNISSEVMILAANLDEPGRLADLAAGNLELKTEDAQKILEASSPSRRLKTINDFLMREIQLLKMQQEISLQARGEMDKGQREYYLRQQLKAIQQELGEGQELDEEVAVFRHLAQEKGMPEEAYEEVEKQLKRLERSHPESAETSIIRTYLEWMTGLPWVTYSEDRLDLDHARKILDQDHYDLEKVKERILEYLAVRKLKNDTKSPILCFVGPPGVGKTSLGRSIARALGREFVRISLGGVRDEAEIRGHRRTYVGALPGRIVQGINQAKTSNPVFMLDEIDKVGADFRGDPSSALLEVLDPEQNHGFRDHYLGVAYDLSQVMFITTANLLEPIQPAFLDRMEVIRLSGYTGDEKLHIARRHLIPKQVELHGLSRRLISFSAAGIRKIIANYTQEAGVRNLERELAAICRKVAVAVARGKRKSKKTVVTPEIVEQFLGPAKHFSQELLHSNRIGVSTGLAWTAAGGDLLFIEVVSLPGKGELRLTGQLGEVMKESAQAALSFSRSCCADDGLPNDYFTTHDIHVHVPAGSVPKDGPSAGITIAAAIVSVLKTRPVSRRIAMTGEITLSGDVLPIGGLKEKVLAARGAGVKAIVLPKLNERDLGEIPQPLKKGLTFHFVEHMAEVLDIALISPSTRSSKKKRPARR